MDEVYYLCAALKSGPATSSVSQNACSLSYGVSILLPQLINDAEQLLYVNVSVNQWSKQTAQHNTLCFDRKAIHCQINYVQPLMLKTF